MAKQAKSKANGAAKPGKKKPVKAAKAVKAAKDPKAAKPVEADGKKSAPQGAGNNITEIRKAISEFATRYNHLLDEMETTRGEIMADVKALIDDASDAVGAKKKVIRKVLTEQRRKMKEDAAEKEMEPSERDDLDKLRVALGILSDLPLGQAAMERDAETKDKTTGKSANGRGKKAEPEAAAEDDNSMGDADEYGQPEPMFAD